MSFLQDFFTKNENKTILENDLNFRLCENFYQVYTIIRYRVNMCNTLFSIVIIPFHVFVICTFEVWFSKFLHNFDKFLRILERLIFNQVPWQLTSGEMDWSVTEHLLLWWSQSMNSIEKRVCPDWFIYLPISLELYTVLQNISLVYMTKKDRILRGNKPVTSCRGLERSAWAGLGLTLTSLMRGSWVIFLITDSICFIPQWIKSWFSSCFLF